MSKKDKSQIEQKDLADDIAKIMGDQFEALKNQLLGIGFNYLLQGNDLKPSEWYKKQVIQLNNFQREIKNVVKDERVKIFNAANAANEMIDLSIEQKKVIKSEIKQGIAELSSEAIKIHNNNVSHIGTKIYRSEVAENLYQTI